MGSFGSGFNGRYWNDGYQWLEEQDQELPFGKRPAFVSWWDYGFQALAQGKHPTVADNFQSGIPNSGNMLLAQSEEDLLALWILTLAEGDLRYSGDGGFTPGFYNALHRALSDTQYDEFVLLTTLGADEAPIIVGHSFTVTHTAGSVALAEGYHLNDIGMPVVTKSYRVYDSREWDGTEHTALSDAMASLNSTKHRNDEVTEDITHYIIGDYFVIQRELHRAISLDGSAGCHSQSDLVCPFENPYLSRVLLAFSDGHEHAGGDLAAPDDAGVALWNT